MQGIILQCEEARIMRDGALERYSDFPKGKPGAAKHDNDVFEGELHRMEYNGYYVAGYTMLNNHLRKYTGKKVRITIEDIGEE
jgi:hypothetical protein